MKPEDLVWALEVARVALANARMRDRIAEEMDLSYEAIKELAVAIEKELE